MQLLIMFSNDKTTAKSTQSNSNTNKRRIIGTQHVYLLAIRRTLRAVFCLMDSPQVIYYNRPTFYPNVEMRYNKEYLLNPLIISRNQDESCLIEASMNSVRISFKLRIHDTMSLMINDRFCRFLQTRASLFGILRKKAMNNYDISFLVTYQHVVDEFKSIDALIDILLEYMMEIEKLTVELDWLLYGRSKFIAKEWTKQWIS